MPRAKRLVLVSWLLSVVVFTTHAAAETANSALSARHRLLLVAARDLASSLSENVWPGWAVDMEVLLVADEWEVLLGGSRLPAGFEDLAPDPNLGVLARRSRVFPTGLLATMPLFGPPATIVVGGPEATERGSSAWLQVLLHEHFHQWQMRDSQYYEATAALDLADGDTTGRWMLEYPFPYDAPAPGRAFNGLARELAALLRRPAEDDLAMEAGEFWARFRALEDTLAPRDARYLHFQLWQEGVARFVELRVAEEAAAHWRPPQAVAALPDFEDFGVLACAAWENLLAELETLDLAADRRISFYALGAGIALLLDRTEPQWKSRYEAPRFALAPAAPAD